MASQNKSIDQSITKIMNTAVRTITPKTEACDRADAIFNSSARKVIEGLAVPVNRA